jgi:hypothetical protein
MKSIGISMDDLDLVVCPLKFTARFRYKQWFRIPYSWALSLLAKAVSDWMASLSKTAPFIKGLLSPSRITISPYLL